MQNNYPQISATGKMGQNLGVCGREKNPSKDTTVNRVPISKNSKIGAKKN